ncbi:MAG: DsbA family protein [Thermoanaerobaculia bacterium]
MKLAVAALVATLAVPAFAASADQATLLKYAKRSMPACPDANVTIKPLTPGPFPTNFVGFEVDMTGRDQSCSSKKMLLYSASSGQVIIGNAIPLPADPRPLELRLSEYSSQLLKREINATVMPFPLPDGLKAASLTRQTEYGPFVYHGYIDQSERFLIIGVRGNIKEDPGKTLLDAVGVRDAVRRGNAKAKIEIVELSDFECPGCGAAHKTIWPIIEKNLSKINFARLDLPLFEHHQWSLPAALGARAIQRIEPDKYWTYVDFMFGNQEAIGQQPFDTVLKQFAQDHDMNWGAIEAIYKSPAEQQAVIQQVERAFDNNVNSTPTFILNGQVLSFGPEGSYAIDAIKSALGMPITPVVKKTAAKKAGATKH